MCEHVGKQVPAARPARFSRQQLLQWHGAKSVAGLLLTLILFNGWPKQAQADDTAAMWSGTFKH